MALEAPGPSHGREPLVDGVRRVVPGRVTVGGWVLTHSVASCSHLVGRRTTTSHRGQLESKLLCGGRGRQRRVDRCVERVLGRHPARVQVLVGHHHGLGAVADVLGQVSDQLFLVLLGSEDQN